MPSRYRRDRHGDPWVERTFHQDLEVSRGWRIDMSKDRKMFILTCKRGKEMYVPQYPDPTAQQTLRAVIHDHDYSQGHSKAE